MKRKKSDLQRTVHLPDAQWAYLKRLADADQRSISVTLTRLLVQHEALKTPAKKQATPKRTSVVVQGESAPHKTYHTDPDDEITHEPFYD